MGKPVIRKEEQGKMGLIEMEINEGIGEFEQHGREKNKWISGQRDVSDS